MTKDGVTGLCVRIIELPSVRMARSGHASLDEFNAWWSAVDAADRYRLFPRDFMWMNPVLGREEWVYALPANVVDSGPYEQFAFPGGLYAVATCLDQEPELSTVYGQLLLWLRESERFAVAPEEGPDARYAMGHVISPHNALERIGMRQMDIFVPIVLKATDGNAPVA